MLCSWCHGKGFTRATAACETSRLPCPECVGYGLLHCCEGLTEQPLPAPAPEETPRTSPGGADGRLDC